MATAKKSTAPKTELKKTIPAFKPFNGQENTLRKKAGAVLATIVEVTGNAIMARQFQDKVREGERDPKTESARVALLKMGFDPAIVEECKASLMATVCYVSGIDTSARRGAGAIEPSPNRKVQILASLVAEKCIADITLLQDAPADFSAEEKKAWGKARFTALDNAKKTLQRMLPPKQGNGSSDKPEEVCGKFGERLARLDALADVEFKSEADPRFIALVKQIFSGWAGERQAQADQSRLEDAREAVKNAETDVAKKRAKARLEALLESMGQDEQAKKAKREEQEKQRLKDAADNAKAFLKQVEAKAKKATKKA